MSKLKADQLVVVSQYPPRDDPQARPSDYVRVLLTNFTYSEPIAKQSQILERPEDIPNLHPEAFRLLQRQRK